MRLEQKPVARTTDRRKMPGLKGKHPVADRISEHLSRLEVTPGFKLPPERELAIALGLTRSVLRKGLDQLEAEGLIWRHVGKGTFVGKEPTASHASGTIDIADVVNPHDLMEVRLFLEPPAVGLAATRATPTELAEIEYNFEKTRDAQSVIEYERWDGHLHRAIIMSTKNLFLIRIAELFSAGRDERIWGKLKERSSTPERRAYYTEQHRLIVEALIERRSGDAESVMREHILDVRADLMKAASGRVI